MTLRYGAADLLVVRAWPSFCITFPVKFPNSRRYKNCLAPMSKDRKCEQSSSVTSVHTRFGGTCNAEQA